ncbi:pilus assembly protein TadG-related protein [Neorhizobium galegae]|uniref:TadE/TadG family type IV pilus assembly protein n=1 Tax=Neorhizobium galegae TaxID=399 RepID=UPI000621BFA5|nr:TadE/TadG family type IV pilus assembly protein [Neorhizobium galegae]MCQ1766296.1 pilus assembly protein TadG-related protein [Neorhizobium galegae]MCQ1845210.1 pilus assembly protein TadG-related protein [Neorhizobium galegae]CDZ36635.1 Flp pilus assembly protein TadG [Neorhizobium galegae bv. officinalis]
MKHTLFARLAKDRGGNFGIMTAALLPVLFAVGGVAVDLTQAMDEKSQLQALADSATLAAASAMAAKGTMTTAEAQKLGTDMYVAQKIEELKKSGISAEQQAAEEAKLRANTQTLVTSSGSSTTAASYEVRMKSSYDVPLSGLTSLLGFQTVRVSVESVAASGREGNALSMYLALDESGSMAWDTTTINPAQPTIQESYKCGKNNKQTCYKDVPNYLTKMESLKAAAGVMFAELETADPTKKLIRIGADSYTHETKAEERMAWGMDNVSDYVDDLPDVPAGGTDASGAMANAYAALKNANVTEKAAHDANDNTNFERFIVLMTDGEMTGNSGTWNSTIDTKVRDLCLKAKSDGLTEAAKLKLKNGQQLTEEEMAKGIKIYTIAFMAPDKGKKLLNYCASGPGYYYEPTDMTTLVESFGEIARKAAQTGTRLTN